MSRVSSSQHLNVSSSQPFNVSQGSPTESSSARRDRGKDNPSHWPFVLTIWILCMAASGFACGVRDLPWWYQMLTAIMPISSIALLWLTHLVDPGIIPPSHEKDPVMELLEDNNLDGVPQSDRYSRDPGNHVWRRRVEYRGAMQYEKLCTTCNIWRPPRGHHCTKCGHCMEHFDHHCDVMGNCIAKNNHRFFTAFLMAAQAGCGLLLGGAIWRLQYVKVPSPEQWGNPESYLLIFLAILYAYHMLMLIFGNVHLVFMIFDVTSKDCVKETDLASNPPCLPGTRNPFRLAENLHALCCAPIRARQAAVAPATHV